MNENTNIITGFFYYSEFDNKLNSEMLKMG